MRVRLKHHVDGCRQSKRLRFGSKFRPLSLGSPGVERWNEAGVLVQVLGPKSHCIEIWSEVTCRNCLSKGRSRGLIEGDGE